MQALTYCDAKITSTRTAVGQFKGQFKGAMETCQGRFKCKHSAHATARHTRTAAGQFKGVQWGDG